MNILSLSQSNSSQRQNDPRTSTLDIAQSTPPNFSEGAISSFQDRSFCVDAINAISNQR